MGPCHPVCLATATDVTLSCAAAVFRSAAGTTPSSSSTLLTIKIPGRHRVIHSFVELMSFSLDASVAPLKQQART